MKADLLSRSNKVKIRCNLTAPFRVLTILISLCPLLSIAQVDRNYISFASANEMYDYFRPQSSPLNPLVQGHRGTKESNFPAGTIPCFEYLLEHTRASIEIDPRLTKDSVMVVFHDAALERSSDGKGNVSDYTWEELQRFHLRNPKGELTRYKIPRLEDVLDWAREKTILVLDHKDVPPEMIATLIKKMDAARFTVNTVWSLDEALVYFRADSSRMFLVSIRSKEPIQSYLDAGIPGKQLIGSLGTKWTDEAAEHCRQLNAAGVSCLLAAASTYDKLKNPEEREAAYLILKRNGVDIIESDFPIKLSEILTGSN